MDFKTTLQQLIRAFDDAGIGYALIGGFAVGLWGVARGTVDLDFLVDRDALPRLDPIMAQCGFSLVYRSENVSQFSSPAGGVDFLHAFRRHSRTMLGRALERSLFADAIRVRVLRPEDLIGLKVQALANDPGRTPFDRYDIEELMRLHGATLDWKQDQFLNYEKTDILCSLHGAEFGIEDGVCILGPCEGDRLRKVSLKIEDGEIRLDLPTSAAPPHLHGHPPAVR